MKSTFSECVGCEVTITGPSELSAHEVHEKLSQSKWTYEIDLMFGVEGRVLKIETPVLLQKKEGSAAWQVTFLFEIMTLPPGFKPV